MTASRLIRQETERLAPIAGEEAKSDVAMLYRHITGRDPVLDAVCGREADIETERRLAELVSMRMEGVPVQYLIGTQYFMGFAFQVTPSVLIPRSDTECLCERALELLSHKGTAPLVLDLCCGSGCIGISLALLAENARVTCADISAEAIAVTDRNIAANGVSDRVNTLCTDLFSGCGVYDMIVTNPPYIPTGVIEGLDGKVRDHEPRMALDGGSDGLDFYRRIAREAKDHLAPGGALLLEIGYDQRAAVETLLAEQGYCRIRCEKDYNGNDRVISCFAAD